MFSNNNTYNDLVSFADQSNLHKAFFNDINPNSKNEDPPFSLLHFPSPFIHYELEVEDENVSHQQQYYDLLFRQQPLTADDSTASEIVVNMVDSSKSEVNGSKQCGNKRNKNLSNQQIPSKRSSKKDRHSKINTAKGPRDRRMRLSLDVARKFFNLQDMLGYDKASKTIEWLLVQAEVEIKKLERCLPEMNYSFSAGAKSPSSTCECEVVSGIDKSTLGESISKSKPSSINKKKIKQSLTTSFRPLTKDLREKARARARERTSKKMWSQKFNESKLPDDLKNNDLISQLCSWSSFEAGEESGPGRHDRDHSFTVPDNEILEPSSYDHQPKYLGNQEDVIDDALMIMGKWSPSSVFNYLHNNGIPQEHQFADFQFLSKP